MEFVNTKITNRKKLLKYFLFILIPLVASYFIKYYFASKEVQDGIKHSRRMLSYNEFLVYSIGTIVIFLTISIASRIILKLVISDNDKTLTVHLIDKFKFNPTVYTVKLSEIQINKHEYESNGKNYDTLQLTNKHFGSLSITELDFIELKQVIDYFENLRLITASQLRQKRLNRVRKKSSINNKI